MQSDRSRPSQHAQSETARARERSEIEQSAALARIATLTTQRDVALAAARRAWLAETHWRGQVVGLEQRAETAERRAAAAEQRANQWQEQATEWQRRFEGLRARLEGLLRRFGVARAARWVPRSLRRFARTWLLGWGRQ